MLFIIDGLHWQAPDRLGLTEIQRLTREGVSVERAYCVFPAHPTTGAYGRMHTTSIPNPCLLAGSLFLRPGHRMLQECFFPGEPTAHGTNLTAYASLNRGFTHTLMQNGLADADVVAWATDLLRETDIRFMRLHLQDTGTAGSKCADAPEDVLWRGNIWADGSPYVAAARRADRLLGQFVADLQDMNRWDDTLLIVMADHGQADCGWHPPSQEDSWLTPLVFVGPGVARGRKLPCADHIDVTPTVCDLMGVEPPCSGPGTGRVLHEIKGGATLPASAPASRLKTLNELLREHLTLRARIRMRVSDRPGLERFLIRMERRYYGIERFTEWHKAGSIDELIRINRGIIGEARGVLE